MLGLSSRGNIPTNAEPIALIFLEEKKGRDLTQSYDKSLYTNRNVKRATWQHKDITKNSITQRLRTDLGRSDGVSTVIQLEWLTGLRAQPSQFEKQPCNQKDTHLKICI